MGVLVRFGNRKAFLRGGVWISADAGLETRLNDATTRWIQETGGPPLHDQDHERTVAREIAGRMGGHIACRIRPSSAQTAELYISRRQLPLDFS
jgi:hypothetical protein